MSQRLPYGEKRFDYTVSLEHLPNTKDDAENLYSLKVDFVNKNLQLPNRLNFHFPKKKSNFSTYNLHGNHRNKTYYPEKKIIRDHKIMKNFVKL